MQSSSVTITILGSRGSIPLSGASFTRYGGATCCVLIRTADGIAVLDAGTGLLQLAPHLQGERSIPVFLSHCHTDHILGLTMCPQILTPGFHFHIYGATRSGRDTSSQLRALMSPPLWPVTPDQIPADITFHEAEDRIALDGILVESMEGHHPGGVTVYRVTASGKRIVYMTDCTITEENRPLLLDFCRDCDLLLCDGQYSEEQWPSRAHFGHNCRTHVARFGADCGAKAMRLLHHDSNHTDTDLDKADEQVRSINPVCTIAFDGEEIIL